MHDAYDTKQCDVLYLRGSVEICEYSTHSIFILSVYHLLYYIITVTYVDSNACYESQLII